MSRAFYDSLLSIVFVLQITSVWRGEYPNNNVCPIYYLTNNKVEYHWNECWIYWASTEQFYLLNIYLYNQEFIERDLHMECHDIPN